ncbi:ricin B lectin domain-containing protein [Umbelopsis sp. AD052]|nr:ricin B lectin domain-containing protein [Umbelopsis sp. AD052]
MSSNFPQGYFYIKSRQNGFVLDVFDGGMSNDTQIIVYPQKHNDASNQLWSNDNGFLINKKSGLVLDIRGGELTGDKPIIQYARKMTLAHNQRWGYHDGFIHVLADPRLVLDIRGGISKEGSPIILYERKHQNNANQQWVLEPYGNTGGQYGVASNPTQQTIGGYPPPPGYQQNAYQQPGNTWGVPRPEDLHEAHREVYKERKAHLSHEVIAGAAAFEAVRAYAHHQQNEGKPIAHPHAKEAIAAIASAEVCCQYDIRNTAGQGLIAISLLLTS